MTKCYRITLKWRSLLYCFSFCLSKLLSRTKANPYTKVIIYTNFLLVLVTKYIQKRESEREKERERERER